MEVIRKGLFVAILLGLMLCPFECFAEIEGEVIQFDIRNFPKNRWKNVVVYEIGETPSRPYEVIAFIEYSYLLTNEEIFHSHYAEYYPKLLKRIRKKAAKIGASAVVVIETPFSKTCRATGRNCISNYWTYTVKTVAIIGR